jgi:AbrB family looped-hinge helix DNA binding protein
LARKNDLVKRQPSPGRDSPARHITLVTSKGQTTIPADIRREAGIEPGDKVQFSYEQGRIFIEKRQEVDELWNAGQSAMLTEWNNPEEDVYND